MIIARKKNIIRCKQQRRRNWAKPSDITETCTHTILTQDTHLGSTNCGCSGTLRRRPSHSNDSHRAFSASCSAAAAAAFATFLAEADDDADDDDDEDDDDDDDDEDEDEDEDEDDLVFTTFVLASFVSASLVDCSPFITSRRSLFISLLTRRCSPEAEPPAPTLGNCARCQMKVNNVQHKIGKHVIHHNFVPPHGEFSESSITGSDQ